MWCSGMCRVGKGKGGGQVGVWGVGFGLWFIVLFWLGAFFFIPLLLSTTFNLLKYLIM